MATSMPPKTERKIVESQRKTIKKREKTERKKEPISEPQPLACASPLREAERKVSRPDKKVTGSVRSARNARLLQGLKLLKGEDLGVKTTNYK